MSVAEISIDASTPGRMAGIIGVRQGEAFEDAELRFNQIEPGGFRGRPDGLDVEPPQESQKTGMVVDVVQIVQNHEKPLSRITTAQATKSFANVQDRLATAKHASEAVCVTIVESQELIRSFVEHVTEPSTQPRFAFYLVMVTGP